MLKRKIEVNYRRANERFRRCKYCSHKRWTPIHTCAVFHGGESSLLRYDWRCEIVGMQSSRRYGIRDDHVCDQYAGNGGFHG
jgi:hypothetical protein